ncbi:putative transcription factor interactor and regulator CCHC(Zn) family [Helianthus annuus]|nr:putative transcription factor interactor and regulator CCHC(Zn) family [Helianthus annuus]
MLDKEKETLISNLDFGNPLYLHPSDTTNVLIISVKLTGTDNYAIWSNAMTLALQIKNKVGFIDGKCVRPTNNDALANQWDRCNSIVLSWILNSISEELYQGQFFSKSPVDVWGELKETYSKIDGSVIFNLHHKINSVSQNGLSVSKYYHKLNSMWRQFDALVRLPSCTCVTSKGYTEFSDLIKLMQFLMGLDDSYQSIRFKLLMRDPLPSVKSAFAIISREESHRSGSSTSKTSNIAFNSKFSDNRRKIGRNPNLKCTHCNTLGHTIDRCYELVGYPPGYKKKQTGQNFLKSNSNNGQSFQKSNLNKSNNVAANSEFPFTNDQIAKLLALVGDKAAEESVQSNMAGFEFKECGDDW